MAMGYSHQTINKNVWLRNSACLRDILYIIQLCYTFSDMKKDIHYPLQHVYYQERNICLVLHVCWFVRESGDENIWN